jgi:hypothetical protein
VDGFYVARFGDDEMKKTMRHGETRGFLGKPTFSFGRSKAVAAKTKSRRDASDGAGGFVVVPVRSRAHYAVADELVGGAVYNGKEHFVAGHDKRPEHTPYEQLAWAILEQAIDDLAAFARAGVMTRDGRCKAWPKVRRVRKGKPVLELAVIAHIKDALAHEMTKRFFLEGTAQWLCDMVGCRLTATEIFHTTLKNHSK